MRIRTVKPSYWPHRIHTRVSEPAALLALALLNYADDDGRFEADPASIASCLFPRRPLTKPVAECLAELQTARWVVLYDAEVDGQKLAIGQVTKFWKHQVINKKIPSSFPSPPKAMLREDYGSTTVGLPPQRREDYEHGGSINTATENSPGNVALPPSQEGKERKEGREGASAHTGGERDFPEADVPSLDQVLEFCRRSKGMPDEVTEDTGREFWEYYEKTAYPKWTDGGRNHFQWEGKLKKWAARDRKEHGNNSKKTGAGSAREQLEAELAATTDAARRRELREQLEKIAA